MTSARDIMPTFTLIYALLDSKLLTVGNFVRVVENVIILG